ncbi:hypothetical protein ABFX02_01G013100 [Erythranthe guttata]
MKPSTSTKPPPSPGGAGGSSSSAAAFQACAVCKYQRRRCTPDCKLAPYFPAHKQKEFMNAHKLFGVHNIVQILKKVPESRRQTAAETIIIEADARARDPVWGCLGVIRELERRIQLSTKELHTTLALLDFYRSRNLPNSGVYGGININNNINVNHVVNQDHKKPMNMMIGGVGNMLLHEGSSSQVLNGNGQDQELLVGGVDTMEQFLNVSSVNEVPIKADDQGMLPRLFLKN